MTEPGDAELSADESADALWFRDLVAPILEELPVAKNWDSICQRLAGESE